MRAYLDLWKQRGPGRHENMDQEAATREGKTSTPWLAGVKRASPIVMGYMPIAVAFGILALKNGLDPAGAVFMSVIVFAGASQFIAVGLVAAGAGPLAIIATTFMVNLRHLLMSAALSPHLRAWSKARLTLFGFGITDETFALHAVDLPGDPPPDPRTSFGVNVAAHCTWVLGTILGMAASGLITDVKPVGLDYALPAMFVALLVAQIKDWLHVFIAVLAGGLSVGLLMAGLDQLHVIIATAVAATVGTGIKAWTRQRSS